VLRLVVRKTERGENLDADLIERPKTIIACYDQAIMRGAQFKKSR
jgi:hypothetical protein